MACVGEGSHAQIVTSVRGVHPLQESVFKTESVTHEGGEGQSTWDVQIVIVAVFIYLSC